VILQEHLPFLMKENRPQKNKQTNKQTQHRPGLKFERDKERGGRRRLVRDNA